MSSATKEFIKRKRSPFDLVLAALSALMIMTALSVGFTPYESVAKQDAATASEKVAHEESTPTKTAEVAAQPVSSEPVEEAPAPEPVQESEPEATGTVVMHFIDVGQGDSEFLELPDGKTMLIDAGESDQAQKIASYISSLGYSKIDYVVATHPHADHIGGMASIISRFTIGEVYAPRALNNTKTYEGFLDAVAAKGLKIHTAEAGGQIGDTSAGYIISILAPNAYTSSDDMNDYSIVLRITYGNKVALFTGDAPSNVIAASGHADLLKVGHHGSKTSTNSSVVSAVSPSIAILSYGVDNSYGHPTQEALDALNAAGVSCYGTGANGTIVAKMTADDITVSAEREGAIAAGSSGKSEGSGGGGGGSTSTVSPDEQQVQTTQEAQNTQSKTVYVAPTGKKYHVDRNCRSLRRSKSLTEMALDQAESSGYEACKICSQ